MVECAGKVRSQWRRCSIQIPLRTRTEIWCDMRQNAGNRVWIRFVQGSYRGFTSKSLLVTPVWVIVDMEGESWLRGVRCLQISEDHIAWQSKGSHAYWSITQESCMTVWSRCTSNIMEWQATSEFEQNAVKLVVRSCPRATHRPAFHRTSSTWLEVQRWTANCPAARSSLLWRLTTWYIMIQILSTWCFSQNLTIGW